MKQYDVEYHKKQMRAALYAGNIEEAELHKKIIIAGNDMRIRAKQHDRYFKNRALRAKGLAALSRKR
ncbi:MAG: hypothetical protein CUN55_19340 [Phototrophicales bacterium]|nr:MAG: hypothetical protein CUN55_19340 [Phototrophicales bacterium]